MTKNIEDLMSALHLSESMLAHARDDEWAQVAELSTQRMACLEDFFSEPVAAEIAAEVEARIRNIQAVDAQLSVLCDEERTELLAQLQSLKKVTKGSQAYQANC